MKKTSTTLLLALLLPFFSAFAQLPQQSQNQPRVFTINNPNYQLSPITGMDRQHWKDAALYILEGAFSYINTIDDPMKFPKQPGISYPRNESQVPTEKLEGLCRTLFVAVPLLKEDPNLKINGISVAEYYRHQILNLINPNNPSFIKHRPKNGGPSQNLVEFGALAVSLFSIPEVLWHPLTQQQKDDLAATMLSYGDGPTVDSNWKFFNIFVLSFFQQQGYTVNEKLLLEYLQKSLNHYRGEGWYNDSPAFDYYSMWAFQMYGVLWSEFYGKQRYPSIAAQFMSNFNDLKDNYPYLFSKNGEMIMWSRSICYRFGAIVPFPLMGFENKPDVNYGWMRRISSGVMLQFLQHPDFLEDNIPTLGFFGHYEPAVQMYSCRGSVFWIGKAFLGLLVPENSLFWTSTENNGAWETDLTPNTVFNKFQKGSEILITDYPNIGASEVRAWCHEKVANDWQKFRSTENYNRLSYNSAFHWQADGPNGEVAMNYVIKNKDNKWEALRLFTFKKFENNIYYRNVVLETNDNVKLQLAEMPLPNGILRVDRYVGSDTVLARLGHYALPQLDKPITEKVMKIKGHNVRIIDNGHYQLALVELQGWEKSETVQTSGLHPVANNSSVINATTTLKPNANPHTVVTLMLWKNAGEKWKKSDFMPVKQVIPNKNNINQVQVLFNGGTKALFEFN